MDIERLDSTIDPIENLTKITKIHLLVHPGFISCRDVDRGESFMEESLEERLESKKLPGKYLRYAEQMGETEVMVVSLPFSFDPHDAEFDYMFDEKKKNNKVLINHLREILKDRLTLLRNRFRGDMEPERFFLRLKQVLARKGFYFDEDVETEAYGEVLQNCVDGQARFFNEEGSLRSPTRINVGLCSTNFGEGKTIPPGFKFDPVEDAVEKYTSAYKELVYINTLPQIR